jgi:uncharacterized membrane protein YphA (DoxX/SURF4 family)
VQSKFVAAQPWLSLIFRLSLGTVLLVAGYLKAINLQKSAMAVRAYEMLPVSVANLFGHVLPWFEIAIGALLIIGAAVKISAALGGFTMLMFIVAISQAWARGLSIDCGCFGGGGTVAPDQTKYLEEILRDFGLMLMAFFLYRFPKGRFGLDK